MLSLILAFGARKVKTHVRNFATKKPDVDVPRAGDLRICVRVL